MQAQPQFTPGQILEAGQRAAAEGRTDYARQFFQHLIDHYRETAEAATARNELMNLAAPRSTAAPPLAANAPDLRVARPAPEPPPIVSSAASAARRFAPSAAEGPRGRPSRPAPEPYDHRQDPPFDNRQHSGHDPHAASSSSIERTVHHDIHVSESIRPPLPAPSTSVASAPRGPAPAPEKNYIAGRVFAGLLAFTGLLGLPVGLVMLYGVFAEPTLFAAIGIATFADALTLSLGLFLGSIALVLLAQIARALFDAADAAGDLARLERYRMGLREED